MAPHYMFSYETKLDKLLPIHGLEYKTDRAEGIQD